MPDNIHSLLKRQINRQFGAEPIPDQLKPFIEEVNRAYADFDTDRNLSERSFEYSSQELLQANAGLRKANKELKTLASVIQQKELFLAGIFSSIQDGISVLGKDLRVLRVNAAMEQWYPHISPLTGGKCFEVYHGRQVPCEACPSLRTMNTGKRDREVVPKIGSGGQVEGWLEIFSFPLVNQETGDVFGVIEYIRDITNLKHAEHQLQQAQIDLTSTQEQLLQSEKMATVGQLAAGVAHEINNPAGFVISNLSVLGEYINNVKGMFKKYEEAEAYLKAQATEDALRIVEEIEDFKDSHSLKDIFEDLPKLTRESMEGMSRIASIVKDLRTFSHSDSRNLEEVDLHELIQSALNIAWNDIKFKAEVVKDFGSISRVRCYPQQLSQVFLNLFVNAMQAIVEHGTITIKTFMDGKSVVVSISDDGIGMTDEVRKHLFEPFYTTKPVGIGVGLGLAIAFNIIQTHKGVISVTSLLGEGTTFKICLPQDI